MGKTKKICLSIDIPKDSLQSPKGIEPLYTQIMSTFSKANLQDKYFKGKVQNEPIGFEMVSLDGYIQFIIYCPASTRDVIESAVFAQYPDAEIVEVPDYTQNFPDKFPSEEWDMWGTEFDLKSAKNDYYPIRTYTDFVDKDSEDARFKDPLAAILEIMSKLKNGENLCLQVLVRAMDPSDSSFTKGVRAEIDSIIGDKKEEKSGGKNILLNNPIVTLGKDIVSQLLTNEISKDAVAKKDEKVDLSGWSMKLKPDQKIAIEQLEKKLSKKCLEAKIRAMYICKKEAMNRAKGVTGIMGTISQFNNPYGASFAPCKDVTTNAKYFRIKQRTAKKQNMFISGYKGRSMYCGKVLYHLNTEELATIFHFPDIAVRAPMISKVESKKVEPPMDLPTLD